MSGSTPPWKHRFSRGRFHGKLLGKADRTNPGPSDGSHGARDDERGPFRPSGTTGPPGSASLTPVYGRGAFAAPAKGAAPAVRRAATLGAGSGRRPPGTASAEAGSAPGRPLEPLAGRIADMPPPVPVRDLATLRRHFPGLGPAQLADEPTTGAVTASSAAGAGVGAAAVPPVPPATPTGPAAELTKVTAVEPELITEPHGAYGTRPPDI
ncbi:hypothetical protein GCM10009564_27320 [Streptomyces thermogriseus]|uniref:Uncharacterized protein n=2 Tax=Streptomyces TaxID=1883 RepID=A0ABN1SZY3_9ACTN